MRRLALVLACGLMVGACTTSSVPKSPVGSPPETSPSPSQAPEAIHLLRSSSGHLSWNQALAYGDLIVRDGCVAVGHETPGTFLIWPRNFSLTYEDGETWVVDGKGVHVARIGQAIRMGGGISALHRAEGAVPDGIPSACTVRGEHYWYAGEIEVPVGPTPKGWYSSRGYALDCPASDRASFLGPDGGWLLGGWLLPGGSAYIRANLGGIPPDDVIQQLTSEYPEITPWDGKWQIVRDGSVIAVVYFQSLHGFACRGSGIEGV